MPENVRASEFTQSNLDDFFDRVERLRWQETGPTNDAIREQAEAFARSNPRPDLETLREHVHHAVDTARGWDHPHDRNLMFDSAVKSYYTLAWLEHLQDSSQPQSPPHHLDIGLAVKITFTPILRKQPAAKTFDSSYASGRRSTGKLRSLRLPMPPWSFENLCPAGARGCERARRGPMIPCEKSQTTPMARPHPDLPARAAGQGATRCFRKLIRIS